MAESIAFESVGSLLAKLANLTVREIRLVSNVTSELDNLTETLRKIKAVRLDAEELLHQMNRELRVWLGRLKDVCASAEDILDEFEIAALQRQVRNQKRNIRKKVRHYSSSSNPLIFRYRMGTKIKEIREALDEIYADRNSFDKSGSGSYVDNKIVPVWRETHSSVNTSDVIGRFNEIELLVYFLNHQLDDGNYRGVSVVSVVGIGGLGKTTLAKSVYNDERVTRHFELKKWVCVTENFDAKKIIGEIVDRKDLSMEQLLEPLRQRLRGQRYLLVLDDVWNEDVGKWNQLKDVLHLCCGGYGSKIVVTTRLPSVATIMSSSHTHTLESLSPEDSLSLLMKWTLGEGQTEHNSSLIEIGKDIAKKSLGVPLAIRTLGSLLYMKTEEQDWCSVRDDKIWKKQSESDILPVLELSYNHLPSHLRQCFSICSMFEKDTTLNSIEMIYIWMALGFLESVPDENRLEAEDIGQDYFTKLCSKSFFQDVEDCWFFYKFKLHDLMHDLALLVTKGESASLSGDTRGVDKKVRHLGFHSDKLVSEEEFPSSVLKLGGLRTIIADNDVGPACSISFVKTCISEFKYLRVLYFKEASFEVLPNSIGYLKHLRYLWLAENTSIKTLPNSFCQLVSLQTLCLKGCKALEKLPKDFGELISLRYLYLTTAEKWLPYLNENDESLNSLRYLEIEGCRNLESLPNLNKNSHLRTLQIRNCDSLLSLPDNLRCLSRVENLVLSNCRKLDLKTTEQDTGSLSSLRILAVEELPKLGYLPMWLVNNQTPLQRLELYDCLDMVSICEGSNPLPPTLKELVIWFCPKLIERCQRDTGEDWHKISHIPKILLDGLEI